MPSTPFTPSSMKTPYGMRSSAASRRAAATTRISSKKIRVLRFTDAPGGRRISYAAISLDTGERDLAGFEDLQLHPMLFELCEKLAGAHLAEVRARLHAAP